MPDKRLHRGPHPEDRELFRADSIARLRQAGYDHAWLVERGYNPDSALKLVGDHFQLERRQRLALRRAVAGETSSSERGRKRLGLAELSGRNVGVDGFNCLITLEAALSGGLILLAHDGAHRDLSSVHGSYRRVSETAAALEALCRALAEAMPRSVTWYLDSPVSNSGRLKSWLSKKFVETGLTWQVELVANADRALVDAGGVVASSDTWVIDSAEAWIDLPGELIQRDPTGVWLVDLRAQVTARAGQT